MIDHLNLCSFRARNEQELRHALICVHIHVYICIYIYIHVFHLCVFVYIEQYLRLKWTSGLKVWTYLCHNPTLVVVE